MTAEWGTGRKPFTIKPGKVITEISMYRWYLKDGVDGMTQMRI